MNITCLEHSGMFCTFQKGFLKCNLSRLKAPLAGLDETLVSVSISRISRSKFLVSVSSRSRKIILQKAWSCLGLEKRLIKNSRLESRVFRVKFQEIHQEILVSFSISRISRSKFLVSVSENHFVEVSVSSRSRNFNQTWSRSRLGLAKRGLV